MADLNLLINAIDFNHDKIFSSAREVNKAKELGFVDAEQGKKVEEVIEQSSKITLQKALEKIDQTQVVDNKDKDDPFKKKTLNLIG